MPDEPRPSLSSLSTRDLRIRAAEYARRAATARFRGAADALLELAAQLERIAAEREAVGPDQCRRCSRMPSASAGRHPVTITTYPNLQRRPLHLGAVLLLHELSTRKRRATDATLNTEDQYGARARPSSRTRRARPFPGLCSTRERRDHSRSRGQFIDLVPTIADSVSHDSVGECGRFPKRRRLP